MPELFEEEGHFFLFHSTFLSLEGTTSFQVIGIHADASKPEEKRYNANNGHVLQLSPDCTMVRGTCGSQTPLWPREFARTAENLEPLPITTLTLQGAHSANRAIILDFGTFFLKVAYLTHTSIQFYSRKVWTESILGITKRDRGFHVGLALEFKDYFIAFLSNDLVFQPVWSSSLTELRNGYVDACQDYGGFLELVAHWIEERAASSSSRRGLVCEVMRAANDVWFGVGVYTITSKTLYKGCWLNVYAKETSAITPRMATLVDLYKSNISKLAAQDGVWYRSQTSGDSPQLYDVFEPNYLRSALESKDIHLGELIFGHEEWVRYGMKPGKPNALAKMFAHEERYPNLFDPYDKTTWRHRTTYTHRIPTKQVWSITPCFPENSCIDPSTGKRSNKTIIEVTGQKRHAMLFSTIVSDTRAVAIGPLEYCGNGKVIKLPHGKTLVSVVRYDPALPQFYAQREVIGLERKADGLGRSGNTKKSMSRSQKQKRHRIAVKSESLHGSSSPPPDESNTLALTTLGISNSSIPPPQKKRRLSADKALVVSLVDESGKQKM
ncbi:hypothetical protein M413DRAFT_14026 [Hebeloma cylindrosporum]|uniref:Uncharacterized protein n=1 Tax=Hebeloma cylindrosporum TaxID=76867 RepID=A0A0C3BI01_HEBCY|nr:hypothetical protein M413DRAFT_14026 [Hebeloma cylindrosporum h7]